LVGCSNTGTIWNSAGSLRSLKIDSPFIDFREDFKIHLPHLTWLEVVWDNWEHNFSSENLECPSLQYLRMGSFSEEELPILAKLSNLTFLGNLSFDQLRLCTELRALESIALNDTFDEADHIHLLDKFPCLTTVLIVRGGEQQELVAKLDKLGVTVQWE